MNDHLQCPKKESFRPETGKIIFSYQCGTNLFCTSVLCPKNFRIFLILGKFWTCFEVETYFLWALYYRPRSRETMRFIAPIHCVFVWLCQELSCFNINAQAFSFLANWECLSLSFPDMTLQFTFPLIKWWLWAHAYNAYTCIMFLSPLAWMYKCLMDVGPGG